MGITTTPHVLAEEINITGNGAASVNEVVVSNNNQSNIEQTNTANVVNNISNTTNTGDNNASGNTNGNAEIVTGDVQQETSVSNTMNQSIVEQNNCCQNSQNNVTISGNGAFSDNKALVQSNNNTSVNVYQDADVINNVKTYANTGNNSASYNTGGDTVIKTGNIKAKTLLHNGPINLSYIKIPAASKGSSSIKIIGNGFGSWNTVNLDDNNETNIEVVNVANVLNNLKENYSTGDNDAKFNTGGDAAIRTGDIHAMTTIDNGPINVSKVVIDCKCDKEKEKEEAAPSAPAAPVGGNIPPPSQLNPGGPAPVTTIAQHIAAGPQLPITGNNWMVLALFGNIMMLLLGAYLRLRSGRSPGFAF